MFRKMLWTVAAVALFLSLPALAEACPNCKEGMKNSAQGAAMIQGYFWSILFMMSMPFLIFGSLSAYMYHEVRKARAAREQLQQSKAPESVV